MGHGEASASCEPSSRAQPRKHNTTKWLRHVVQISDDDDSHDDDLEDEDEDGDEDGHDDGDRAFSVGHATPLPTPSVTPLRFLLKMPPRCPQISLQP